MTSSVDLMTLWSFSDSLIQGDTSFTTIGCPYCRACWSNVNWSEVIYRYWHSGQTNISVFTWLHTKWSELPCKAWCVPPMSWCDSLGKLTGSNRECFVSLLALDSLPLWLYYKAESSAGLCLVYVSFTLEVEVKIAERENCNQSRDL